MPTYPVEVGTFNLTGKLIRGIIDSGDADTDPDVIPIVGAEITLWPAVEVPIFRVPTATPPVTIYQETLTATTDVNGFIVVEADPEPTVGVVLMSGSDPDISPTDWEWKARVVVGSFPELTYTFNTAPGGTVDLSQIAPD